MGHRRITYLATTISIAPQGGFGWSVPGGVLDGNVEVDLDGHVQGDARDSESKSSRRGYRDRLHPHEPQPALPTSCHRDGDVGQEPPLPARQDQVVRCEG